MNEAALTWRGGGESSQSRVEERKCEVETERWRQVGRLAERLTRELGVACLEQDASLALSAAVYTGNVEGWEECVHGPEGGK